LKSSDNNKTLSGAVQSAHLQAQLKPALGDATLGEQQARKGSGGLIMSRLAKICCHEVMPQLNRRSVLAGITGLITLAPLASAHAKDELLLANLVGPDGQASDLTRSMTGQTVRLRGYLAPSLDGREFALSESSPCACQLCGAIHDPGATITIRSGSTEGALPIFEPVLLEGQLVVIGGPAATVVLLDAKTRTL
jgi:hypothetical protein